MIVNEAKVLMTVALIGVGACVPTGSDGGPSEEDPGLVQLRVVTAPTGSSVAVVQLSMVGDGLATSDFAPASGVAIRVSMPGDGTLVGILRAPMSPGRVLGTLCVGDRRELLQHASANVIQLAAGAPSYALLNASSLTIEPIAVDGGCTPSP